MLARASAVHSKQAKRLRYVADAVRVARTCDVGELHTSVRGAWEAALAVEGWRQQPNAVDALRAQKAGKHAP
eukprot:11115359-Alexandrium_andersonii.AAC.1